MFDLGFSELLMVFVVALVVLGPKRMPGLVKEVGRWVGKARAMARQFRDQLETEVNLEDLANSEKSSSSKTSTAATPAPVPGMNGEPAASTGADAPAPYAPDYGGTYPYGTPAEPEAVANSIAPPQPGDDTYSHAHAHSAGPYFPPEAESFEPAHDMEPAQQELALNDSSLQPDPSAPEKTSAA